MYSEDDVYAGVVALNNKVVDVLFEYVDVKEIVTDEVILRYLRTFCEDFTPGLLNNYLTYTTSVIGRQLDDPVDGKIFIPTPENLVTGQNYIRGPHRYSLTTTYLLPLAMYATLYYTWFPCFLEPQRKPHIPLNYASYNDFRDNQTCISLQARYMIIRESINRSFLDLPPEPLEPETNDPKDKIEFYTFEGDDEPEDIN